MINYVVGKPPKPKSVPFSKVQFGEMFSHDCDDLNSVYLKINNPSDRGKQSLDIRTNMLCSTDSDAFVILSKQREVLIWHLRLNL